jgi:hypothetical protein
MAHFQTIKMSTQGEEKMTTKSILALVFTAGLLAATDAISQPTPQLPVRVPACQFEGATYLLPSNTEFELTIKAVSGEDPRYPLGVVLTQPSQGRSWQFEVTASNGYSSEYLVARFKGLEDSLKFFFIEKSDLKVRVQLMWMPKPQAEAPIGLLIPELGPSMHYSSNLDPSIADGERVTIPTEIWMLSKCGTP